VELDSPNLLSGLRSRDDTLDGGVCEREGRSKERRGQLRAFEKTKAGDERTVAVDEPGSVSLRELLGENGGVLMVLRLEEEEEKPTRQNRFLIA